MENREKNKKEVEGSWKMYREIIKQIVIIYYIFYFLITEKCAIYKYSLFSPFQTYFIIDLYYYVGIVYDINIHKKIWGMTVWS